MNGFLNKLFSWYLENARDFPFRRTRDPYLIWLSEIIMQQTRIEQGVPYYNKFVSVFPTVHELAAATEEDVLKQWQGLGYYTRARNLHSTANEVVEKYAGRFPETYEGLRSLKGVGDYTAAAIASVCFGLPHPVVDGNVIRFITRYFGITASIEKAGVKKEIMDVLEGLMEHLDDAGYEMQVIPHPASRIPHHISGDFNQSMIDFGATYCVPRNPACDECIFASGCYALKHGMVNELPLKKQQQSLKTRYFHYLVIHVKGKQGVYFSKRTGNDIWKGLYEFPMLETPGPLSLQDLMNSPAWKQYFGKTPLKLLSQTASVNHLLSHQKIIASFCRLEIETPSAKFGMFVRKNKIHELPVARILEKYLEDHAISEL